MRRTPIRRSLTPIERRTRLPRSTKPIRATGKGRKCYRPLRDEPFKRWARETREIVPGIRHRCAGVLEFAHVIPEGIGGPDRGNGIVLCTAAHTGEPWSWHRGHRSFQKRFGIDAAARARVYQEEYEGGGFG